VSKTLSQLRDILNDELFYRDGTKLIPTPFALQVFAICGLLHSQMLLAA
jgi:DNA-binding transcriptional LysR family regulator